MKKRLVIFTSLIILVSVVGTSLISAFFTLENYMKEKEEALIRYCKIISSVITDDFNNDITKEMTEYASIFSEDTGYRITLIDSSGTVLSDSEAQENYENMNNHGSREEVIEALKKGIGISNRQSESFGKEYLYVASLAKFNTGEKLIVRIAMEINTWEIAKNQVISSSVMAACIGIIMAIIISLLYASRLMRPVRQMEKQLKIAMAESEKAENIRKDFVANVTHELKTPLTSITGFAETIQDDPNLTKDTENKFLGIIIQESSRLGRLMDDILIISDIESGRETNTDEDINIVKAIKEVVQTLTPIAERQKIILKFEYQYEMYIGGNDDRFKQMMFNIIENAIKYSDNNSTVNIFCEKKEDSSIYIHIKDHGIGIAEENIDRLFERFYRVDKSRSKEAGGTGLGLAIVKHIATLFDAQIKVNSKLNEGTEFILIFPHK